MVVKKGATAVGSPEKIDWKRYVVWLALLVSGFIVLFYSHDIAKL